MLSPLHQHTTKSEGSLLRFKINCYMNYIVVAYYTSHFSVRDRLFVKVEIWEVAKCCSLALLDEPSNQTRKVEAPPFPQVSQLHCNGDIERISCFPQVKQCPRSGRCRHDLRRSLANSGILSIISSKDCWTSALSGGHAVLSLTDSITMLRSVPLEVGCKA